MKTRLRENKKCQNCGRFVAERFCPQCGQENVETHRRFHSLFIHFFEDFIHYDSQFWRTIKDLFLPAKLTQAYLAGKRKTYVPPVKLYIFISFLVFFISFILPDMDKTDSKDKPSKSGKPSVKMIEIEINNQTEEDTGKNFIEKLAHELAGDLNDQERNRKEEIKEALIHHFPKAIFLYMPVFSFWLWVFHSKKKWFYFDHGIYTLHYFSFVLLTILCYILVNWLLSIFHTEIPDWITILMLCYFVYYFFHSHRKMYQESKARSRTKCMMLFFINTLCMMIFFLIYIVLIYLFFKWKGSGHSGILGH
ncbi:MAG: DUF3667 domain-containing protein [Dysgonamonadaceae bacterium]|nr:DUF3667 domain-containing protein [Dysgonamonadaceae bacterium]